MSMTIWVNINHGEERESNQRDHTLMLEAESKLDTLADELSVPRLSSFYDDTDLRFNFDENGEFPDSGWTNADAKWFDPEIALRSLTAIVATLQCSQRMLENQAGILKELQDCKIELEKSVSSGKLFHFCLVM